MNIHDQWSDDHWFLFCQKTGKNGVKASSSASTDPIKSKDDPINDPIKLSEREQKLMSLIEKHPNLTRKELADQLSCSDSTVKRELKILSDIGLIKREGARKNGRWIITKTE